MLKMDELQFEEYLYIYKIDLLMNKKLNMEYII